MARSFPSFTIQIELTEKSASRPNQSQHLCYCARLARYEKASIGSIWVATGAVQLPKLRGSDFLLERLAVLLLSS